MATPYWLKFADEFRSTLERDLEFSHPDVAATLTKLENLRKDQVTRPFLAQTKLGKLLKKCVKDTKWPRAKALLTKWTAWIDLEDRSASGKSSLGSEKAPANTPSSASSRARSRSPRVAGTPRTSRDHLRATTRLNLAEALGKHVDFCVKLAATIEEQLHLQLPERDKYKAQAASIIRHLREEVPPKNNSTGSSKDEADASGVRNFKVRVLRGEIKPVELPRLRLGLM